MMSSRSVALHRHDLEPSLRSRVAISQRPRRHGAGCASAHSLLVEAGLDVDAAQSRQRAPQLRLDLVDRVSSVRTSRLPTKRTLMAARPPRAHVHRAQVHELGTSRCAVTIWRMMLSSSLVHALADEQALGVAARARRRPRRAPPDDDRGRAVPQRVAGEPREPDPAEGDDEARTAPPDPRRAPSAPSDRASPSACGARRGRRGCGGTPSSPRERVALEEDRHAEET